MRSANSLSILSCQGCLLQRCGRQLDARVSRLHRNLAVGGWTVGLFHLAEKPWILLRLAVFWGLKSNSKFLCAFTAAVWGSPRSLPHRQAQKRERERQGAFEGSPLAHNGNPSVS
ncbi:hypothetical protein MHYP_G00157340 [Metynnis hypsauchen]